MEKEFISHEDVTMAILVVDWLRKAIEAHDWLIEYIRPGFFLRGSNRRKQTQSLGKSCLSVKQLHPGQEIS